MRVGNDGITCSNTRTDDGATPTVSRRAVLAVTGLTAMALGVAGRGERADAAGSVVTLVNDGVAAAQVVVPETASEQVLNAARLLVDCVVKATGVELSIVTPGQVDPTVNRILLGIADASTGMGLERQIATQAGIDGYVLCANRGVVTVAANSDHGIRHGVLDLLEKHVGVRWLMPGEIGEDIPSASDLQVPTGLVRHRSPLISRLVSPLFGSLDPYAEDWKSARPEILWASHMRLREWVNHGHNLNVIFDSAKYGQSHPEFYPLVNGVPAIPAPGANTFWQPNFSEPGTVTVAAQWLVERFRSDPDLPSASLAVNDGRGFSENNLVIRSDGWPNASEDYYAWVNAVVDAMLELAPDLADRKIGVLAYRHVMDPPSFSLRPQVIPYLTRESYQWIDPDLKAEGQAWVKAWSDKAPGGIAFYDYVYGGYYPVPKIFYATMQESYDFLFDHGLVSHTSELYPNWGEGAKPMAYAKLLWDPETRISTVVDDWYAHAVGPAAAPHLKAYYDLWEAVWREDIPGSDWFRTVRGDNNEFGYFSFADFLCSIRPGVAQESRTHLEQAVALADTAERRARAEKLLRAFEYYESSILSFPPNAVDPSEPGLLDVVDDLRDNLAGRVEHAQRRLTLASLFAADPLLRLSRTPMANGTMWTGYSGEQFWALVDHIREHGAGSVATALAAVAQGPVDQPAARFARLVSAVAGGTAESLIPDPSFEHTADDDSVWQLSSQWSVDSSVARTGAVSMRLEPSLLGDMYHSTPVRPGLLAIRYHYRVPEGAGTDAHVAVHIALQDARGARIAVLMRRLAMADPTGDGWGEHVIMEDIPASLAGKAVAKVQLISRPSASTGRDPRSGSTTSRRSNYRPMSG